MSLELVGTVLSGFRKTPKELLKCRSCGEILTRATKQGSRFECRNQKCKVVHVYFHHDYRNGKMVWIAKYIMEPKLV